MKVELKWRETRGWLNLEAAGASKSEAAADRMIAELDKADLAARGPVNALPAFHAMHNAPTA